MVKRESSAAVSRDENGEKVGAGFAGQRVDPGVSVTPSAIIIAQRPFVESLTAKGIAGAGRGIPGAWGVAF